jgi:hypothetical protein
MKFVNGFISSQPQKFVSHGNQKALTAILQSLQFGLNHGSHEVSVAALESIFSLSQCFLGAQQSSLPPAYAELFQKSAGECISIFLYGTYDVALIEPTGSNTLFVLILVCGLPFFNSQLHAIAEKIMQRQSAGGFFHDSDKERLLQAFAVFSNDTSQVISLANQSNQRECRRKFQKILVTWLEKIRGLVAIR